MFQTKLVVREARSAADFRHPNIVRIYDVIDVIEVIEEGKLAFIVSEFIEGYSRRQWLVDHQPSHNRSANADSLQTGRGSSHA